MSNFRQFLGIFALTCASAVLSVTVNAQTALQNIDNLDVNIRSALDRLGGGLRAQNVDRRLRLAQCPEQPDISGPVSGAMVVRCGAAGWRIRVPLIEVPGTPISSMATVAPMRAAPPLIRRGDQIQILVSGRNFSIRTIGFAEQDGSSGQRIRVRNERRIGLFTGLVQDDGSVLVSSIN